MAGILKELLSVFWGGGRYRITRRSHGTSQRHAPLFASLLFFALALALPASGAKYPAQDVLFLNSDLLEDVHNEHPFFTESTFPTCDSDEYGETIYISNATTATDCAAGTPGTVTAQCFCDDDNTWKPGGGGGGAGTSIVLDLDDDDSNESEALTEIAIVNGLGSIFTESSPDKLLIDGAFPWPTANELVLTGGPDIRPSTSCTSGFYTDLDGDGSFDNTSTTDPESCINSDGFYYAADYATGSATGGIQEAIDAALAKTGTTCGTVIMPRGNTTIDLDSVDPGILVGGCIHLQGYGQNQQNTGRAGTAIWFERTSGVAPVGIKLAGNQSSISDALLYFVAVSGNGPDAGSIVVQCENTTPANAVNGWYIDNVYISGNASDLGTGIELNGCLKGGIQQSTIANLATGLLVKNVTTTAKSNANTIVDLTVIGHLTGIEFVSSDGDSKVCTSTSITGGTIEQNDVGIKFSDSCNLATYGVHFENNNAGGAGANVLISNDANGMAYVSFANRYGGSVAAGRDIVRTEGANGQYSDSSVGDFFEHGVNYSGTFSQINILNAAQVDPAATFTGATVDTVDRAFRVDLRQDGAAIGISNNYMLIGETTDNGGYIELLQCDDATEKLDFNGTTFSCQTDREGQPLDTELSLIAGLAETTGNVMIGVAGAWSSEAQPAIDCTNCTAIPAASDLHDIGNVTLSTPADGSSLCFTGTANASVDCTIGGEATATEDAGVQTFTIVSDHAGSVHHAESHAPESHTGQGATAAELETLTDASDADSLHTHDGKQPLDTELSLIAGLAETTGNVMIGVAGAWSSEAQPAIDCTNCTAIPAATDLNDIGNVTLSTPADGASLCFTGTANASVDCTIGGEATATEDAGVQTFTIVSDHAGSIHHADESAASESVAGILEIATPTEITTGTDNTRAVSPDGLADAHTAVSEAHHPELCNITMRDPDTGSDIFCNKATAQLEIDSLTCVATGGTSLLDHILEIYECTDNGHTCVASGFQVEIDSLSSTVTDSTGTDSTIGSGKWWGVFTVSYTTAGEYIHCQVEYTR